MNILITDDSPTTRKMIRRDAEEGKAFGRDPRRRTTAPQRQHANQNHRCRETRPDKTHPRPATPQSSIRNSPTSRAHFLWQVRHRALRALLVTSM